MENIQVQGFANIHFIVKYMYMHKHMYGSDIMLGTLQMILKHSLLL